MTPEARCKEHWANLGITDEKALKEHIQEIFAKHEHQNDVLVDIYKLIFPNWNQIESIEGHPEAGHTLWKFICNKFIEFDHKYHPKVFKGGIWLNTGFSTNSNLNPWEISFENCNIIMN